MRSIYGGILWAVFAVLFVHTSNAASAENAYTQWKNGPSVQDDFFPISVWLQNPRNAARYRAAGFNTYVGLWRGPTEAQLAELKSAGMKVICEQNKVGLEHLNDPTIIGWMHGDEPDNAQSLGNGKGYGPPILPDKIAEDYRRITAADPSRPVLLNLGQGVAWDGWHGRGVRTNHPEDYPEYARGGDIISFDIYPASHDNPDVAGNLWYVPKGVERLVTWTEGNKVVWNCIECTRINHPSAKATPHQVKCEVWMSLIHGSMGLIYFVHEWQPTFNEAALLSDGDMLRGVTAINRQIHQLAPVLNSPTLANTLHISSSHSEVPIAAMVKRHGGSVYVFAVAMRQGATKATFSIPEIQGKHTVEVLGEDRTLDMQGGVFTDEFDLWDVHLYRVADRD
ncbi:MAG: hypothetical protein K9N55_06300 [Phycisphaerae bacterium]|nr:hypothetical protein [Phycisphaerae bacterium]